MCTNEHHFMGVYATTLAFFGVIHLIIFCFYHVIYVSTPLSLSNLVGLIHWFGVLNFPLATYNLGLSSLLYYLFQRPILSVIAKFLGIIMYIQLLSSLCLSETYILVCSYHFSDRNLALYDCHLAIYLFIDTYSCFYTYHLVLGKVCIAFYDTYFFKHVLNVSN